MKYLLTNKRMQVLHLWLLNTLVFVVPLAEGEVAYSGKQDSQRWSDAQEKCKSNGKNLAKIRNIHDITEARKAFIQHHSPPYWVGVKFDTSINNFVWGDGTNAPNHVANFEAVVNRDEQLSQGYNMRCMLIESDENELQAAQCSDHYKYICQSGEHEDPGVSSPSLLGTTSLLSSQSTTLPALLPSLTSQPTISLLRTVSVPPLSSVVSSPSSPPALLPSLATRTTLLPTPLPTSVPVLLPTATIQTQKANSVEAEISLEEKLINEFAHEMDALNVSELSSLKRAVNITSSLLKDIHKVQPGELRTNMLVHLDKLEKFALNYAKLHIRSDMNNSVREISFVDEDIAVAVLRIPALYNKGVFFPSRANASVSSGKFWKQEEDFIKLPYSLFTTQERFTVCMLHNNATGLMPKQANILIKRQNTRLVSRIISCTLSPKVHDVFSNPVTINFQSKKENVEARRHCVFWDFSISSRFHGAWSQDGCTLVDDQHDTIMCGCNHLTNFAVLMEVGETKVSASDNFALGMVTYIGTSLSLLGEFITILVYIFVFNVKSMQSHIRLNMVFCLAIAQLIFLTGISATEQRPVCIAVAITINYFYLVAFGWMVMEGVMLYLKVVKVFNVTTNKKYFYGFAWGFPTFLVTIAVAINTLIHGNMDGSIRNDACWFSFSSGFVWVFVGPVLVACLVNLAILSRIIVEMVKMKDMPGNTETSMVRQSLKACAVLSPLLGFTWMFGILTVTRAGLVFQYMFTILNSSQGFVIFVFHIVLSKEARTALKTRKKRWETTRSASMANEKSSLGKEERKSQTRTRSTNKISPSTPDNFNLPPVILNK